MAKRKPKADSINSEAPGLRQDRRTPPDMASDPLSRFRDRIVDFTRRRAGDLEPHPANPRLHSGHQIGAVTGLLTEVGKCIPLLAFPADGLGPAGDFSRLMFWDGHCRRDIHVDEVWPVAVTDLTRAEVDKMILAKPATENAAEWDPVKTRAMMDEVNTTCQEVADMLTDLWGQVQADAIADVTPADPVDAEPQTDRAEELREKWGTAAGQLWLLGSTVFSAATRPSRRMWRA